MSTHAHGKSREISGLDRVAFLRRLTRADRVVLRIVLIVAIAYLALVAVNAVVNAVGYATDFAGYAADGPFQLYNPLRRLQQGELVGEDFPFFHGVGVLLVHVPLFELLGGNLFASEMSRWLMSPAFFLVSGFAIAFAAFRDWKRALIALAVYTAIVYPMDRMVDPSNSLYGIRTTFPLLAAAALLWRPRRPLRRLPLGLDFRSIAAYGFLGLAVSFGTEQGVASIGAYLIVRFVQRISSTRKFWATVAGSVVDVIAIAVIAGLTLTALTVGHPLSALSYALQSVPLDQGWVFGAPPNVSLTWDSLFWELRGGASFNPFSAVPGYWMLAIVAAALVVIGIRARRVPPEFAWALGYVTIYGLAVLVAVIGYINFIDQMAPLARGAALITALAVVAIAFGAPEMTILAEDEVPARPRGRNRAAWLSRTGGIGAGLAVVLIVLFVVNAGYPRVVSINSAQLKRSFSQALKGPGTSDYDILGPGWKYAVDSFAPYIERKGVTVWSTYTSAYDSIIGEFNSSPGGEDYIIHALGPERREAYEQAFIDEKPDYVITVNPAYFIYEEWVTTRWPEFYDELYRNYDIAVMNGSHFLWERKDAPEKVGTAQPVRETESEVGPVWRLPANSDGETQLYRVKVKYSATTSPEALSRLPRYLLRVSDTGLTYPISLPYYADEWEFYVPVLPGQTKPELIPVAVGIVPSEKLEIESMTIEPVTITDKMDEYFEFNYCFTSPDRALRSECKSFK